MIDDFIKLYFYKLNFLVNIVTHIAKPISKILY